MPRRKAADAFAAHVKRVFDAAPPLTAEQRRARLATLLTPPADGDVAAGTAGPAVTSRQRDKVPVEAVDWYRDGASLEQIAAKVGVSSDTVRRALLAAVKGIPGTRPALSGAVRHGRDSTTRPLVGRDRGPVGFGTDAADQLEAA